MANTPHLDLVRPTIGNTNTWGDDLNANFGKIDANVTSKVIELQLLNQSAAIPVSGFSPIISISGLYRVNYYARVTQAASGSSTLGPFQTNWRDPNGDQDVGYVSTSSSGNTLTTQINGTFVVAASASIASNFQMAYASSGGTPMQYCLRVSVEFLL